ncbi:hypothetical protein VPH35_006406 [Triticum aestivum]
MRLPPARIERKGGGWHLLLPAHCSSSSSSSHSPLLFSSQMSPTSWIFLSPLSDTLSSSFFSLAPFASCIQICITTSPVLSPTSSPSSYRRAPARTMVPLHYPSTHASPVLWTKLCCHITTSREQI